MVGTFSSWYEQNNTQVFFDALNIILFVEAFIPLRGKIN